MTDRIVLVCTVLLAAVYFYATAQIPTLEMLALSLVLGGIMEQSFRQAMTISGANPAVFVQSAICVVLLIAAVILLLAPVFFAKRRDWRLLPRT